MAPEDIMENNITLSKNAYTYLDKGDAESAEKILEILKKKEITPELKFTISALLIEIGTITKRIDYIDEGITNYKELKKETEFFVDYNLANGYVSKYKIMTEKPNYLTKDAHLLTKAKQHYINCIGKIPEEQIPLLYINLGNTYNYIGRTIDALDYYEKVPTLLYSLINKGIGLYEYSKFINNRIPILKDAYDCFKSVETMQNIPSEFKPICERYIATIETICNKQLLTQKQNKTLKISSEDNFESFLINFCLKNKLYLNLCNFCQRCNNAIGDSIIIPNIIVKINESLENDRYLKLSSQLNQIKMDFVLSRFLLVLSQMPNVNLDLISKNVVLINTLSYEENDIHTQLLKNSFSNFYNLLDKISHLINIYFELNKDSNKLSFHNVWFNRKNDINGKLCSLNNLGLNALYDIHLELEPEHEKFYLRKIRNNLTHNFLQIKYIKTDKNDLTLKELKDNTIELAKMVKNAIIYLIRAIDINEKQKYEKHKDKVIPKITNTTQKL